MGFYTVGKRGTIIKQRFNVRGACKRLYEAMQGIGTNEDAIIEVIGSHTVKQRQDLKVKYKIMYGKDLIRELSSELSGTFLKIVLALMTDPEEYILETIRNAIVKSRGGKLLKKLKKVASKKGLCSDAYTLLAILCLRSNDELDDMKKAYKAKYEIELEEDFGDKDFADEFRSLIFGIILAQRDESPEVDLELIQEDIECLHSGGGDSTREEYFQAFFEERSWKHLKELYNSYEDVTGESIEKMVESSEVYSDIMKESYSAVIKLVKSEADFYAERLKDAIEGLGTDDSTLVSVVVLRSEIDLVDIIERYEALFDMTLEEAVDGDTSGDYNSLLKKLLTVPEFDDDDTHSHAKVHHKKPPGKSISTQTDPSEDDEEPVSEDINKADHHKDEAIGHDVVDEKPPEEEEEEEEDGMSDVGVEEIADEPALEETEEEAEETAVQEEVAEVEEEIVASETVEEVQNEEPEAADTEAALDVDAEGGDEEKTVVMEDNEEDATSMETAATETGIVENGEEVQKKKTEEIDNAEGG